MKLLMHIGTHKTATTTFQKLCTDHRNLLSTHGINFPNYNDWDQHSYAAWTVQRREISEVRLFLTSIYTDSQKSGCKVTLLSGEDFENFLVDLHLAKEFTEIALEVGFEDVEWVVVKRDALDYLKSIYAEHSLTGVVLDYQVMENSILTCVYMSTIGPNYNYKFVFDIKKYAQFFKKHVTTKLRVVSFENFIAGFVGKEILSDYLPAENIDVLQSYANSMQNLNISRSQRVVEIHYSMSFLGIGYSTLAYDSNKPVIDGMAMHRLKRNTQLLSSIEQAFAKKFD